MERLTDYHFDGSGAYMVCSGACIDDDFDCNNCEKLDEMVDRLAAYEDFMERWRLRDLEEAGRIFQRVNALGGTDLMAQYRDLGSIDHLQELVQAEKDGRLVEVVRCKDCKHLYFKDFSGFCPHRVSACSPDGFCEYGERRKPEESEAALKGWANRESLL